MTRRNRDVEQKLIEKFSFQESKKRSGSHRFLELKIEDQPLIVTHFSHSKYEIDDSLLSKIAKQLRVTKTFLDGMIDCTNDPAAYHKKVKDSPLPLPGFRS